MPKLFLTVFGFVVFFVFVLGAGGSWLVQWLSGELSRVREVQHADLKGWPITGVKRVELRANRADVKVHAETGNEARCAVSRFGSATSEAEARKRADEIVWNGRIEGDALLIDARVPDRGGSLAEQLKGGPYRLLFELWLPRGPAVDIKVDVGDLYVLGTGATTRLASGTGDIEAVGIDGDLTIEAGTGDVVVTRGKGATEARAETGSVRVEQRPGPKLAITTETGDLDWVFTRDVPAVNRLQTDTGSIHISLAKDAGLALELESETGQVTDRAGLKGGVRKREDGPGQRASFVAGKPERKLGALTKTGHILVEGPIGP